MINIIKALDANKKEAIKILKTKENNTITFDEWDEESEGYSDELENCPWIRYANDDGDITTMAVIACRYNKEKKRIEIMTATDYYEKSDGFWFPLSYADDISYWSVFDYIGDLV